ncbi:Protein CBG22256 [Caenorhabditis briggsae]|uniref:E3 ubiquitin-protein ligase n=1 Tax=Caenorhabditis briggsae TaxID=6238 RepID=A8Y1X0_CAEBR|nr:Protein CBG22256 [Caenorhabditis briggsae]CAP38890.2 Protein CBG22256 [Caenorhabditis briggsae]
MVVQTVIHGYPPNTDNDTQLIRVRLLRGQKIGRRDLFGVCSPYCLVRLENSNGDVVDEVQVETKRKTRHPVWNSVFTFRVTRSCQLKLLVYDENRLRKDSLIGFVSRSMDDNRISTQAPNPEEYPLATSSTSSKGKSIGSLLLTFHFVPSSSDNSPADSTSDLQQQQTTSHGIPQGWEEREDGNGRTVYINHALRTTQFTPPESIPDGNTDAITEQSVIEETRRRRDNYEHRSQVTDEPSDTAVVSNELTAVSLGYFARQIDDAMRANFERGGGHDEEEEDDLRLPDGWDMQVAPNGRTFFIDHRTKTTTWTDPRTGIAARLPVRGKTDDEIGALPPGWEQRVHVDGRVFFIDHNRRRTQWEDPRFENENIAGPAVPYSRDYKRKVEYLRSRLPKPNSNSGKCDMVVHRDTLFEDSYRHIMDKKDYDLRNKLWIEFFGETGLDYGGVTREWFFLLSHQIFNPYYGLFEYSATDNYTLQINPHSEACNPEHLSYFHFIGRIIGMAIYHGKLLDAFFIRPFYKMMLGKKITLFDMESVDNAYYNSLIYVKDNDPADLELTFSLDDSIFGETQNVELIPGGANVAVTEENKEEYIEAVISWRFVNRIEKQMNQILKGVQEVVPSNLLRLFDANELELLMCGLQKIDVKDWKANTIYKGGYGPSSQVVHNFWKCILSFDNEMRARVLQFVSGTSRVPMNGFRELYGSNGLQKFTIERWGSADMLPRAHTCFNRLDLPPYTTFKELKSKLLTAIENSEIFSGVD